MIRNALGIILVLALAGCSSTANRKAAPDAAYHAENGYMQLAIDEARDGIYNGDGGPVWHKCQPRGALRAR